MPLARFDSPFEHPDWIFEPKLDGFRALAYVEGGACRLVSRNRNAFKTFEPLAKAIGQELSGRSAILDGEIVRPARWPDGDERPWASQRRLINMSAPLPGTYSVRISSDSGQGGDHLDGTGAYSLVLAQAPEAFDVPSGDDGVPSTLFGILVPGADPPQSPHPPR
jgi:hypothetical protein